jgi:uncharacterized iron-regulated protein
MDMAPMPTPASGRSNRIGLSLAATASIITLVTDRMRDTMRLIKLALLLLFALPVPLAAADQPLIGRIWLPATGDYIDADELARRLAASDMVLLGEKHDNPEHHRLQDWALGRLLTAGRRPVVAAEMISPDQEPALRLFLAEHGRNPEGLGEALGWAESGWPDWAYYRPFFDRAVTAGLPLRPANLPRDTLRALARSQPVPPETRVLYRLDQPLPAPTLDAMADEIREAHCGQLPESALPGMVAVQRARDAAMAHAMADDAPDGAVLIAGSGHTRSDRGVPTLLAALAPGRSVISLGFVETTEDQPDPAAYGAEFGADKPPFDAVWFTTRTEREDGCAAMTKAMQRKAP